MGEVKLTFCLRRKSGMTADEFHSYWQETHGPLVRKLKTALGVYRYTQIRHVECEIGAAMGAVRNVSVPFDGVAELYWRSMTELETALRSTEGREAGRILLEDEQRFIDLENSPIWLNEIEDIFNEEAR
ncbi:EthD domain-containing protein [Sneathiella limimaris]|uniref:EthD domain-containing protein n=1 Tax=Sneathiella limimaris TaxID=1964213 RepID=UPI00146BCC2A|nr:EthD domain-containing protein [Sneathiella limimaris]